MCDRVLKSFTPVASDVLEGVLPKLQNSVGGQALASLLRRSWTISLWLAVRQLKGRDDHRQGRTAGRSLLAFPHIITPECVVVADVEPAIIQDWMCPGIAN